MKLLALAVLVPATALASFVVDNDLSEFLRFESRFNKVYSSEDERRKRFEVFKQNLADNRHHNSLPKGLVQERDQPIFRSDRYVL